MEFTDILHGRLSIPSWLNAFLRIPEFVRLRGVRLSNVDSIEFKDFSGATRWEHSIGVAALAIRCAEVRRLSEKETVHLGLAALLHDVATPPFAHTLEHVLEGFDHELESHRVLRRLEEGDSNPNLPVFASELPQFSHICEKVSREVGFSINVDEVARLVTGEGENGFLLNGSLDLDNADNVVRASLYMGIDVDRRVPFALAEWLAAQSTQPIDLEFSSENAVRKWLHYRKQMYAAFFNSSSDELGREAFLQHLCRRALAKGIPRSKIIWNTDDGLLSLFETHSDRSSAERDGELKELVQRYRLLYPVTKIGEIDIADDEALRILRAPAAVAWIERELSGHSFSPFVLVNVRRYKQDEPNEGLFPPPPASIQIFKLGDITKANQLPDWLRGSSTGTLSAIQTRRHISETIARRLPIWVRDKPWQNPTPKRRQDIRDNLEAVGDWSFRLSRNETLHPYPSTFVHAIPACVINSLGLGGELILDPFGGTGQTAIEAIKAGGRAVTSDINSIAGMVARAKLTFLNKKQRNLLRSIRPDEVEECEIGEVPEFDLAEKWHHPKTFEGLCRIRTFIRRERDSAVQQFMLVAFSAILTSTTGRKGREHGFFADNTPLEKGTSRPPFENPFPLFISRLHRNLDVVERLYSHFERGGRDPQAELKRAKVLTVDATRAHPSDYGLQPRTVAGVITSPPYLCMSDYSLGQRLSYYWICPDSLKPEHLAELGARRRRFQADAALSSYLDGYNSFARLCSKLVRPGGFLVTILGVPVAKSFADSDVISKVHATVESHGFSLSWSTWRAIQWHRNHGYARVKKEQVAVYCLAK